MALLPVKITQNSRLFYNTVFLILITINGLCGVIFMCKGFYVFLYIGHGLFSFSKEQINNLSLYLFTIGAITIFVSATGYKYSRNLFSQPTNHATSRVHWVWLYFSATVLSMLVLSVLTLPELEEQLSMSVTVSLNHGLNHFYSDTAWKAAMDDLQVYHQCCGVTHYTDWYRTSWLPLSALPQDQDLLDKYAQSNGLALVPLVPSSCCKSSSTEPCGEKTLSGNKSTTGWHEIKPTDPATINVQGCLPATLDLWNLLLLCARILFVLSFVLQCIIMTIARYLFTSTRNSVLLGNPHGTAIGWVLGQGDFCFKCGKTLPEYDSEIFKGAHMHAGNTSVCKEVKCLQKGRKSNVERKFDTNNENAKYPTLKLFDKFKKKKLENEMERSDGELTDTDGLLPKHSSKHRTSQEHKGTNESHVRFKSDSEHEDSVHHKPSRYSKQPEIVRKSKMTKESHVTYKSDNEHENEDHLKQPETVRKSKMTKESHVTYKSDNEHDKEPSRHSKQPETVRKSKMTKESHVIYKSDNEHDNDRNSKQPEVVRKSRMTKESHVTYKSDNEHDDNDQRRSSKRPESFRKSKNIKESHVSHKSDDVGNDHRNQSGSKKVKESLNSKKSSTFRSSEMLHDKSGNETDLTEDELKSNKLSSRRSSSRRAGPHRHDETLDIISVGRNRSNADEDCNDCDEFAFGIDDKRKSKRKSKSPEYRATTQGSHVEPPKPPPLVSDLDNKREKNASARSERKSDRVSKRSARHENDQHVYTSVIDSGLQTQSSSPERNLETAGPTAAEGNESVWAGMKAAAESYNVETATKLPDNYDVQTQTSGAAQTQGKGVPNQRQKDPVKVPIVFRNYRIPQKNISDSRPKK